MLGPVCAQTAAGAADVASEGLSARSVLASLAQGSPMPGRVQQADAHESALATFAADARAGGRPSSGG